MFRSREIGGMGIMPMSIQGISRETPVLGSTNTTLFKKPPVVKPKTYTNVQQIKNAKHLNVADKIHLAVQLKKKQEEQAEKLRIKKELDRLEAERKRKEKIQAEADRLWAEMRAKPTKTPPRKPRRQTAPTRVRKVEPKKVRQAPPVRKPKLFIRKSEPIYKATAPSVKPLSKPTTMRNLHDIKDDHDEIIVGRIPKATPTPPRPPKAPQGFSVVDIFSIIKNEANEPLTGATVVDVNDKTKWAEADYTGRIALKDVRKTTYLEIRHIGYKTLKYPASDFPATIVMQDDVEEIGGVTIIGKTKKKDKNSIFLLLGLIVAVLTYFKK